MDSLESKFKGWLVEDTLKQGASPMAPVKRTPARKLAASASISASTSESKNVAQVLTEDVGPGSNVAALFFLAAGLLTEWCTNYPDRVEEVLGMVGVINVE
jgi:hypothetical protein